MIGKSITNLRKCHNLSQKAFAEKCGITRGMVAGYESLTREPKLDVLLKISNAFNISTDDLLKGTINKESENYEKNT